MNALLIFAIASFGFTVTVFESTFCDGIELSATLIRVSRVFARALTEVDATVHSKIFVPTITVHSLQHDHSFAFVGDVASTMRPQQLPESSSDCASFASF
jgi:hypothetical protein